MMQAWHSAGVYANGTTVSLSADSCRNCRDSSLATGMGRAPGTALAFMYWCRGFQLMDGHSLLTSRRACHPKLAAIRAATCDVLFDQGQEALIKINLRSCGWKQKVQVMVCSRCGLRPDEAAGNAH